MALVRLGGLLEQRRVQLVSTPSSWEAAFVEVTIDCRLIGRPELATGDGDVPLGAYRVDDYTDPPTVEVLGEYCKQLRETGGRVDIITPCVRLHGDRSRRLGIYSVDGGAASNASAGDPSGPGSTVSSWSMHQAGKSSTLA